MKYIVIEIQKLADGTIAVPPVATFDTFSEAASRYHSILAVAAVSDIPRHSAVILDETGIQVRLDSFNNEDPDAQ